MEEKQKREKLSSSGNNRRNFLKLSALAGIGTLTAGFGIAKLSSNSVNSSTDKSYSIFRKEFDSIDDIYDIRVDYKRMDEKNTVFNRGVWDPKMNALTMGFLAKNYGMAPNPLRDHPAFDRVAHALGEASWAGYMSGAMPSENWKGKKGPLTDWKTHYEKQVNKDRHSFKNPQEAAAYVKRASKFLGASDVGIAPFDERWIYEKWYDGMPAMMGTGDVIHIDGNLPFKPKSVIVMVHEMDYDGLKCEGNIANASIGKGYSDMAETAHKTAVFLNQLGYKALPVNNDTSLSIPTAIQAGLGEGSRMGLLIHEKFGPRLRIAKVYTDMEIQKDKPITFGVTEFCMKCKKCAEECPSDSISLDTEPSWEPKTGSISSHTGVKKWFQNNETCYDQWEKIGTGCAICVSVCPYNKLETWVHDISKAVVSVPVGRDIARQMDDAFGYGKLSEENVEKFWNK